MTITRAQKLAAARRELAMRRRVYPRWVEAGRMTAADADHEIAVMAAIVADYEGDVALLKQMDDLFGRAS